MKKSFLSLLVLVLIFALSLSSCAGKSKSLEKCGNDVISLMDDMLRSDEYAENFGVANEHKEIVEKLRSGDYSSASAIYELSIPEESLTHGDFDFDDYSGDLKEHMRVSLYSSFVSQLNAKEGGSTQVVATSIFAASKSYVCKSLEDIAVYLYVFENGYPIVVVFTPGESGAIRAYGNFLLNEGVNTDDAEQIEESFSELGIRKVKAKKI